MSGCQGLEKPDWKRQEKFEGLNKNVLYLDYTVITSYTHNVLQWTVHLKLMTFIEYELHLKKNQQENICKC